eukprot:scaffold295862_cov41-Tisochrysis_lutea.AAC.1
MTDCHQIGVHALRGTRTAWRMAPNSPAMMSPDLSFMVIGVAPCPPGKHSKTASAPTETPRPQERSASVCGSKEPPGEYTCAKSESTAIAEEAGLSA